MVQIHFTVCPLGQSRIARTFAAPIWFWTVQTVKWNHLVLNHPLSAESGAFRAGRHGRRPSEPSNQWPTTQGNARRRREKRRRRASPGKRTLASRDTHL